MKYTNLITNSTCLTITKTHKTQPKYAAFLQPPLFF